MEGKTRFFRTLKADYEMYSNFALRHHKTHPELLELMFNNQLRIKALLLNTNQKIRHQILTGKDETLKQVFIYWQEKRNELAKIYLSPGSVDMDKVKALGDTINSAETYLSRSSAEFKSSTRRSKPGAWQEIAGSLKKDQAVVEIVRFREFDFLTDNSFGEQVRYGALILSGNTKSFQFVILENGKELETKYYNYYIYTMQGRGEDTRSYTGFFGAIADKLKDVKTVYMSPDGIFYKINFNTLVDPRDGKFLIEKFDIRLLTNSRELTDNNNEYSKDKVAVLVGFPNYTTEPSSLTARVDDASANESVRSASLTAAGIRGLFKNVAELPGTLDEIESIETTLSSEGWHVTKYLQNDAREENLKKQVNPRILHIATHGYFEQTDTIYNPLLASGLLLTGASVDAEMKPGVVEDGILTAYEAMNLNLDATQLVVLSACETGKGVIQNGEGVYGLQSAFKVAGAKNIIMSLWKVDDQATQKLMSFFYKNYSQTASIHTALKEAQLSLKKEYGHPFYWGAFVLIGQ